MCSQSSCCDTAPKSEIPNCCDSSQHEHRVRWECRKKKITEKQNPTIVGFVLRRGDV
ncbi:hypothetical protein PDJAM_G00018950 [Pangasius djambal]|uniref:Uncharacterized protein n=1 Tax=Pangasius djambal TaxID=1691987 RepID=A0ACC5YMI9_9TELE|nr:hypothetical protein [Pangasius djambal]